MLNKIAEGTVGSVYEIKLRNSDNCNQVSYAIKVIDASRENHDQYWNCYEHLKKEYIAYYLLTLGKEKEKEARSVIQNFTPSCYGLYRPKDKSMDVFVLIIELAGSVSLRLFKLWSATERCVENLLLHCRATESTHVTDKWCCSQPCVSTRLDCITVTLKKGMSPTGATRKTVKIARITTRFLTLVTAPGIGVAA